MTAIEKLLAKQREIASKQIISHNIVCRAMGQYLLEFIDQALALLAKPCEWKWNKKDKYWDTACGCAHVWQEKHLDTRFRSCPFCARPIKETR